MVASHVPVPTETDESDLILSPEEGRALFEREAQRMLGISGDEFLRRWDAGVYRNLPETPATRNVLRMSFFIPFVRAERG